LSGNVASCYRNRLKLRIDRPLSSNADYTLSYNPKIGQQSVTTVWYKTKTITLLSKTLRLFPAFLSLPLIAIVSRLFESVIIKTKS